MNRQRPNGRWPAVYATSLAAVFTVLTWTTGVQGQPATQPWARVLVGEDPLFRLPEKPSHREAPKHGVILASVAPGSGADRGGLHAGDVVLSCEGRRVGQAEDLLTALTPLATDDPTRGEADVAVDVWRRGQTLTLTVPHGAPGIRVKPGPVAEVMQAERKLDALLRATAGGPFVALPGTRCEVEAIARWFACRTPAQPPMLLLAAGASERRLAELASSGELERFNIIHLATHGLTDDRVAMRSALILSQDRPEGQFEQALAGNEVYDGRLTADQIVQSWKLNADLVVLSGCQTALGQVGGGQGYLGFSQALFISGARTLLLSLWKIDDAATALLMVRFYENLLGVEHDESEPREPERKNGNITELNPPMSKVEALREAKLWPRSLSAEQVRSLCIRYRLPVPTMLVRGEAGPMRPEGQPQTHPFEHPCFWAAFVLIGNPD